MFNNLGIFSGGFPQGPIRPGIGSRGPSITTIQLGSRRRRGGVVTVGTNAGPTPPLLRLTVTSTTPQTIPQGPGIVPLTGMLLTSTVNGNFTSTFDADYGIVGDLIDITAAGAAANTALAAQLAALPGGVAHGAVFGNGETLLPGVYDSAVPASIQGILTLDGGGNPNALFVIRVAGALTSVAASQVQLINGAQAKNVFWRSAGATALGANTIFRGTALAVGGAAGIGAGSVVNGRLLSTLGAVTTDTSVVNNPGATTTAVILGVLETFGLFASSGAVANTGTSVINGNIGTNLGLITGYGLPTVVNGNVYIPGSLAAGPVAATFGIYKNGVLIPGTLVSVSGPTTITAATVTSTAPVALLIGDVVTARATAVLGTLTVNTRTLTLQQV